MKTLLLSQRVDRHWLHVVNHSKMLQKKLFFLPATKEDIPRLHLLEQGAGRGLNVNAIMVHEQWDMQGEQDVLVLNPLLMQQNVVAWRRDKYNRRVTLRQTDNTDILTGKSYRQRGAMGGSHCSWRRMLLVQSPPSYPTRSFIEIGRGIFRRRYTFDTRFTLRALVAAVEDVAAHNYFFAHAVQWCGKAVFFGREEQLNCKLDIFGFPVTVEDLEARGF